MEQEEVGAYIRLLCCQWNKGHIPKDRARMENVAGGSVSEYVLSKFNPCEDGELRNERMEKERDKQIKYRQKQSEYGRLGGRVALPKSKPAEAGQSPSSPSSSSRIFIKPSLEELNMEGQKQGLPPNEILKFQAFYESKDWKVGKEKMKSWRGAMSGWRIRWEEQRGSNRFGNSPQQFDPLATPPLE